MCSTAVQCGAPVTLGELLTNEREYSVTNMDSSGLKMRITSTAARKNPVKPAYRETTSTPFELIVIHGNISKGAGCGGNLKSGPDPLLFMESDKMFCIRHKENDHVFLHQHNHWKKTFSNKHYYVLPGCLSSRNPSFDAHQIVVTTNIDSEVLGFLRTRFR